MKYQRLPCIGQRSSPPPAFFREPLVPQYEISDCGTVIEIELRRFRIEALITLDPSTPSLFDPFLPWAVGRSPALSAS